MRFLSLLRTIPAVLGLAGVLGIAIPLVAGASPAAEADPQDVQSEAPQGAGAAVDAVVADRSLRYGQAVDVRGRLTSGEAGVPVALQVRPAGAPAWWTLRTAITAADGRFRLSAALRRTGDVRVVAAPAPLAHAASVDAALGAPASSEQHVRVRARIVTRHVRRHLLAGRTLTVAGALRPGGVGRAVALQLKHRGGWRTVDRDRTSGAGRFSLRQQLDSAISVVARVRFSGDGANAASRRSLGRIDAYRLAFASWYGPGLYGNRLGCGGTLTAGTLGVAHKSLPCGTMLTLRYRGHTVRAPVVDRGPYVGGREFDLTAATRARLGFPSTGWVQVSQ